MVASWSETTKELAQILFDGTSYEASPNPQDLNLPGYWVTPVSRSFDTLAGTGYTAIFEVFAVCPNYTTPIDSLDTLSAMHDEVRALNIGVGDATAEVAAVQLTNKSADPLPALKITLQVEVE